MRSEGFREIVCFDLISCDLNGCEVSIARRDTAANVNCMV